MKPGMGHATVERKVKALIRCSMERFWPEGSTATALRIADAESGYWPWAYNSTTGCIGVFQQMARYWPERLERFLKPEWFNDHQWERLHALPRGPMLARGNVILSVRMAKAWGWGHWSTY